MLLYGDADTGRAYITLVTVLIHNNHQSIGALAGIDDLKPPVFAFLWGKRCNLVTLADVK